MTVTPESIFSLPLAALRRLVALSPTFQQAVGAMGIDEAARVAVAQNRVYPPSFTLPQPVKRPFAWVRLMPGYESSAEHSGMDGWFRRIPLRVMFEIEANKKDDAWTREYKSLNWFGKVVRDMEQRAKEEGQLYVTSFRLSGLTKSDPKADDCYDSAMIEVSVF